MNSRMNRVLMSLVLGLVLLLGLLLAMDAARPPDVALAQGSTIRYVAPTPTGNDSGNDCTNSSTPCATVQHAVDMADPGDEIRVATGTYTGVQARAGGITQVIYINKTVTIRGGYTTTNWSTSIPISYPTTLDALRQGRVLYITGEISPTIEGLRIINGDASGLGGSTSGDSGGGVYVITATFTMSNSQVFSNTALVGGGLYFQNSNETLLVDNLISDNSTAQYGSGGGLYFGNSAHVTLTGNTISNNEAGPPSYGFGTGGGVMFVSSPEATLSDNTVSDNRASWGGGLKFSNSPTATLTTNTISRNVANHAGSGMKDHGGVWFDHSDDVTLISNTISGNHSANHCGGACFWASDNAVLIGNAIISNTRGSWWDGQGAGMCLASSRNMSLISNTICHNTASHLDNPGTILGGGLYIGPRLRPHLLGYSSTATLISNTISSNGATRGGGLLVESNSVVTLTSAIITGNTVYDDAGQWPHVRAGGGLCVDNSIVTLTNVVVADNQAETVGSGLYINSSSPRLLHTTIARNSSGDGSGVYITGTTSTVAMTNTILVSHTVGITVTTGNTAILNGVLWYSNTINYGGMGTITVTNEYTGDPAFTADGYHLTTSSAAIDRGVDAGVRTDIDGGPRPLNGGADIGADETGLQMLIPLYIYPTTDNIWDDVAAASSQISITAIINPNSGSGGTCIDDYKVGIQKLDNAGVTVLGYIYTLYATRPITTVTTEVNTYHNCYQMDGLDGIFLDQVASDPGEIPYYKELCAYVKSKPNFDKAFLNPGTQIDEGYLSQTACDAAVIFEGFSDNWPPYSADDYVSTYPPERFAALIHTVPDTDTMRSHIDLAWDRNIGFVYATDDTLPNPWDTLPTFWQAEVDCIALFNEGATNSLHLPLILKNSNP